MSEKTDSLVASLRELTSEILRRPLSQGAQSMARMAGLAMAISVLFQELDIAMREEKTPLCREPHKDGFGGLVYGVVMPYEPYEGGGANLQEEFTEHADMIEKAYNQWLAKSST